MKDFGQRMWQNPLDYGGCPAVLVVLTTLASFLRLLNSIPKIVLLNAVRKITAPFYRGINMEECKYKCGFEVTLQNVTLDELYITVFFF